MLIRLAKQEQISFVHKVEKLEDILEIQLPGEASRAITPYLSHPGRC